VSGRVSEGVRECVSEWEGGGGYGMIYADTYRYARPETEDYIVGIIIDPVRGDEGENEGGE
jgi:hypothetical protein